MFSLLGLTLNLSGCFLSVPTRSFANFCVLKILTVHFLKCCVADGNFGDVFSMDGSSGSIVLARPLDRETRDKYTLTISVTDGTHTTSTWVSPYCFLSVPCLYIQFYQS